jgi:hypothetical protein
MQGAATAFQWRPEWQLSPHEGEISADPPLLDHLDHEASKADAQ